MFLSLNPYDLSKIQFFEHFTLTLADTLSVKHNRRFNRCRVFSVKY